MASVRERMPNAAELAAALRKDWGDDFINEAIRNGLMLQREYLRLQADEGQARADAWLRRQDPQGPVASFTEGDMVVGLLPGRQRSTQASRARR